MAAAGLLLLVLLAAPATALNITKILEPYPDFSTFSSLLNQTNIASQINSRSTITVLAVENGAAGALSGQPTATLAHILSVHVILDYFDAKKLHQISNKSAIVTTLFQSSGVAVNRTGFLNITDLSGGQIGFGSAVSGAGLTANFVKEVVTQPYNISVIQVSGVIYTPGISGINTPPSPPPPAAKTPAPAPAKAHSPAKSPAPTKAHSPSKSSPPSKSPKASSPAPSADAPGADTPTADAHSADVPSADEKSKSSASRVATGAGLAVAFGAAFLAL